MLRRLGTFAGILCRPLLGGALTLGVLGGGLQPSLSWAADPRTSESLPALMGTVVAEAGESKALFSEGDKFAWYKTGEEIASGFRLLGVESDRVFVKRKGSDEELQVFLGSAVVRGQDTSPPQVRISVPSALRSTPVQAQTPGGGPGSASPLVRAASPAELSPKELEHRMEEIREDFRRARSVGAQRVGRRARRTESQEPEDR